MNATQRVGFDPRTGRIVRIRDEHEPRALVDERSQRIEIVTQRHRMRLGQRLRNARRRAGRLHDDRIDRERVLRIHRFALRRQKCFRQHDEHIVRTVAERDAVERATVLARERLLQRKAIAVRIETDLGRRLRDRCARHRPGPKRILVRRELDAVANAVLALELLERLARHVRRKRADVGGSELSGIEGMDGLGLRATG